MLFIIRTGVFILRPKSLESVIRVTALSFSKESKPCAKNTASQHKGFKFTDRKTKNKYKTAKEIIFAFLFFTTHVMFVSFFVSDIYILYICTM